MKGWLFRTLCIYQRIYQRISARALQCAARLLDRLEGRCSGVPRVFCEGTTGGEEKFRASWAPAVVLGITLGVQVLSSLAAERLGGLLGVHGCVVLFAELEHGGVEDLFEVVVGDFNSGGAYIAAAVLLSGLVEGFIKGGLIVVDGELIDGIDSMDRRCRGVFGEDEVDQHVLEAKGGD